MRGSFRVTRVCRPPPRVQPCRTRDHERAVGFLREHAGAKPHARVRWLTLRVRADQRSRFSSSARGEYAPDPELTLEFVGSPREYARTQRSHWSSSVPRRVYPGPTVTLECRLPRRYARTQRHPRVRRLHRRARDGQRGTREWGGPGRGPGWPRSAPFASMRSEVARDFIRFLRAFVPDPRSRERVPVCVDGGLLFCEGPHLVSGAVCQGRLLACCASKNSTLAGAQRRLRHDLT
jgi:hypothetical protein